MHLNFDGFSDEMCFKFQVHFTVPQMQAESLVCIRMFFCNMPKDTCLMTLQYVPTLTHTSRANKFITAGRIRPMKIRPASSPITEISSNLRSIYTKTRNRSIYIKKTLWMPFWVRTTKDRRLHSESGLQVQLHIAPCTTLHGANLKKM